MTRRPKLTPAERQLAVALAEIGYQQRIIAGVIGCSPHTIVDVLAGERALDLMAKFASRTRSSPPDLAGGLDRLRNGESDVPSITCPVCDKTSYNPHDVANLYCGFCNWWTSDPMLADAKP